MYKSGTYMWTASSAGWFVLWVVGAGEMCALVSLACAGMAWAWHHTIGKW